MHVTQLLNARFQSKAEQVEKARAEFNFNSIREQLSKGCKVLDVGGWSCYLGELLRSRMSCDVLSLDVVDANKTDLPFQVFDGKTLPVESHSFDVVLLLYVLHHAAEDQPLLDEAGRVLRDDGRVLVAEDSVDGLWNRILTVGFHVWLKVVTRMGCDGVFRTTNQWQERFRKAGLEVKEITSLGHHLGHFLWPKNVLFVLGKTKNRNTTSLVA